MKKGDFGIKVLFTDITALKCWGGRGCGGNERIKASFANQELHLRLVGGSQPPVEHSGKKDCCETEDEYAALPEHH
jgi:hypothetical protein